MYQLADGRREWDVRLPQAIAGGVGAGEGVIAVGTLKGVLLAYDAQGKLLWQGQASSEIIAPPAVGHGVVLVRTGDGKVAAFDAADGKLKWQFQRQMPALTMRNYALSSLMAVTPMPVCRAVVWWRWPRRWPCTVG